MDFLTQSLDLPGARANAESVLARVAAATKGELFMLHSAGSSGGAKNADDADAGEGVSVIAWDPLLSLEYPDGSDAQKMEQQIAATLWESPHPLAGWLGFVSYDVGRAFEHIGDSASDDLHWPVMRWCIYRNYLVREADGTWKAIRVTPAAEKIPIINAPDFHPFFESASLPIPAAPPSTLRPHLSAARYAAKVQRVRDYIAAGDIYQANLAQRWSVESQEDPVTIFRRLMQRSPAAYASFIRFTGRDGIARHVLSASPELFIQLRDGHIVTRPIKGTRRRDRANPPHDAALRAELLASPKDQAELAMIVDLLRNDVGRIARFGTVHVTEPRTIEALPTVWHTVATIEADTRPDVRLAEFLRALCPGGSITGAPKIRAMQIIEELEGFRRGLYCGNIGVITPASAAQSHKTLPNLTLNIAIRTIVIQQGIAHIFAGGGVVADSDPHSEYEETLTKASAMFAALGVTSPT